MGDQIGQAVEGTLHYIPFSEFKRVQGMDLNRETRVSLFADMCRLNTLYMIARAGSGHIGSSFSSMDIFSWLLMEELKDEEIFFSSKGHDAPGYYAALIGLGKLDEKLLQKLRKIDGLPGHPDISTPEIVTNTGSLGMGVSKAKGMILANRQKKKEARIFVMTGDGEIQEGQFWESLISAANFKLHELHVIIDHNKLQSDTFVKNVSDLGDLEAKLNAFGWRVERCDGNNINAFSETLESIKDDPRPKIIIADTVKGKGVSFMEHTSLDSDVAMYRFHSGAPDASSYNKAANEIMDRLLDKFKGEKQTALEINTVQRDSSNPPSEKAQRLVAEYGRALIEQAEKNTDIVALDADLILDTGLIPFRDKFPDRFVECGIAEQDMVSVAGGMALNGALPVVHSFACFLSSRPNEQIYNNATEKTKIIYVASLAGVLPGGPGHSHQAVRDISSLAAVPGLIMMEPSCEAEVSQLLDWSINKTSNSSYLRLMSLPWELPYELPSDYQPSLGKGVTLKEGSDIAIITYGPVPLSTAFEAATILEAGNSGSVKIINLPWLNAVDAQWLQSALGNCRQVISIDNHYAIGGQGDRIAAALLEAGQTDIQFRCIGLNDTPPSGTNPQVLSSVGLDAENIAKNIRAMS